MTGRRPSGTARILARSGAGIALSLVLVAAGTSGSVDTRASAVAALDASATTGGTGTASTDPTGIDPTSTGSTSTGSTSTGSTSTGSTSTGSGSTGSSGTGSGSSGTGSSGTASGSSGTGSGGTGSGSSGSGSSGSGTSGTGTPGSGTSGSATGGTVSGGTTIPSTYDGVDIPAAPSPPPAPAGFAGQLDGLYSSMYGVAQTLDTQSGGTGSATTSPQAQLPAPTEFQSMVSQLTTQQLAQLYAATQQVSGWSNLPGNYQAIQSGLGGASTSAASVRAAGRTDTAFAASGVLPLSEVLRASQRTAGNRVTASSTAPAATFPPTPSPGSYPAPPAGYLPTAPIAPADIPLMCPLPPPGPGLGAGAIESAQESLDDAAEVATILTGNIGVILSVGSVSTTIQFPDPAGVVASVLANVAQIVLDTLNFEMAAFNDCGTVQTIGLSANIDNTTYNTYQLATLMESTLGNVQNSVDSVSSQIGTVQQTLDEQLTLTIEQALSAPASTVANIAYELPASVGGNLDSTPVGVQSIVGGAIAALQAAGEPVNASATTDLSSGDADLAAHNYSQAYAMFHAAYLAAVQ